MKKYLLILISFSSLFFGQTLSQKLDTAIQKLQNTPAAYAANISMYVADDSGKMVYAYQPNKGLSTASTQKIFTAATALDVLGKDYRYTTTASFSGNLENGVVNGNLIINSNGDPTLGSWRYDGYLPEDFQKKLINALQSKGITKINGDLVIADDYFDFQTIPGGWPWDDLGNYYGAGVFSVNWRENQFDIHISGKNFKKFSYDLVDVDWVNELSTGGSSDQSLIFTAPFSSVAYINGMLPAAKTTTVSGATPNPPLQLGKEIKQWLQDAQIDFNGKVITNSLQKIDGQPCFTTVKNQMLLAYQSPTLDKIVYWFLKKSVNLYGETLIKTLGKEKRGEGSFASGIAYLKEYWIDKGLPASGINFADGSGLSPQNYVSAKAEVQVLLYAKKQPWFAAYFDGFPVQGNQMKMKSGTMKNTKSFAGIHTSASGKTYYFSIIINNYQGSEVSNALYNVLNILK